MAFLATTLGSPSLCVRGGVQYEHQTLVPDSGAYNFTIPSFNNWSFVNSVKYQNERIRGEYDFAGEFEQGYFNFESWNGRVCSSIDGTKSGYQSIVDGSSRPYLANFWGRGETGVSRDALYNYGFAGEFYVPKAKNITTACVMSGVNTGVTGSYPDFKVYIGSLPSGEMTVYGRVGSVNPNYEWKDKILSFNAPRTYAGGTVTGPPTTTSYIFAPSGTNKAFGTFSWFNTGNITVDDSSYAEADSPYSSTDVISDYLVGYNFALPTTGATVTSIEAVISSYYGGIGAKDYSVRLFSNNLPVGTDKATNVYLPGFASPTTYTWSAGEMGGLTGTDIADSTFGIGFAVKQDGTGSIAAWVNYIKVRVTYETSTTTDIDSGLVGNLTLVNNYDGEERRLNWIAHGFGQDKIIDMPNNRVTSREFSNFLMTYSKETGIGKFYTAKDDEPFTLENVVLLGNISSVMTGETVFYEDSYGTAYGTIVNNPKIVTDYGISNRAWTDADILRFDQHRLNGAYYIDENPLTSFPPSSGSDSTSLNFHFPVGSSGRLGSCDSGNYQAINYYIPLSSGVNERLYEFDDSRFNSSALTLDLWASNTGTNPSGKLGARIDFCNKTGFFSRDLLTVGHYWSGYPVSLPSGISQIRMSGEFYNSLGGPSNLSEVTKIEGNNAGLYFGSWYENIGSEYCGDIKVYNARIGLDGFVVPATTNSSFDVYCSGQQRTSNNFPLFLQNSHVDSAIDIYMYGKAPQSGNVDLYISGGFAQNNIPIFMGGKALSSGQIDLFIEGSMVRANMPLYIYSEPPAQASGDVSLFMWATSHSGAQNSMYMFIGENAPSGVNYSQMNLFTQGPLSQRVTSAMNLVMRSDVPKEKGSISLFCSNQYTGHSGQLTLFMQAPSGTLGAIPLNANMNLYLNRATESVAHNMPISISGPFSSSDSIPINIIGANKTNGGIPLYTDGVGVSHETLKLYEHGF